MNFVPQLFLVALISFFLSQGEAFSAQLPRDLGFNKFDLPAQYLGNASGGNGQGNWLRTTRAMGEKAVTDARYFRAGFVRVSMTGFAPDAVGQPSDLDLWLKNPTAYWTAMDRMMADLDRLGLKLVPVFVWNPSQFPAMVGETVSDLLTRPKSQSRNLLERYVREFITRYRARPTVAFYELTNELNNGADLDMVTRCKQELGVAAPNCLVRSNYTTNQMNGFTVWLAAVIRTVDSGRSISSGFSVPRPISSALRVTPEWVTGNVNRPLDNPLELERYILDVHRAVDIVSVHIYPVPQNRRFGANEEALLERLDGIVRRAGKRLYLGEFGDPDENKDSPGNFVERMLAAVERIGVQWASPWLLEFYQRSPYLVSGSKADAYNLEPGYTSRTLALFRETSCRISSERCRLPLPATPPRVVLTWPIGCTKVGQIVEVFAVASENADYTGPVSFGIDDRAAVQVDRPPYRAEIPIPVGSNGRVFARACNVVGCSEDSVPVNRPASECAVPF